MAKRMRTAAKPAVEDAQRSVRALATKSSRGGGGQARRAFAESKARRKSGAVKRRAFANRGLRNSTARAVRTQVKSSKRSATVRIRVQGSLLPPDQRDLPSYMNSGRWRHPVMGNRRVWVTQTTSPRRWFDAPMSRHGGTIRDRAVEAVDQIQRDIVS
jgi:hypothetical protein